MELKRRYNPSTLLIEDSPISLGLIQSLREQSFNVTTSKPDTDKRARLIAQTDLFAGGSVRVLIVNSIPLAQSRESGDAPSHGGYAQTDLVGNHRAVPITSLAHMGRFRSRDEIHTRMNNTPAAVSVSKV